MIEIIHTSPPAAKYLSPPLLLSWFFCGRPLAAGTFVHSPLFQAKLGLLGTASDATLTLPLVQVVLLLIVLRAPD